ncbi:hypothetical protein C8R48DRAFT_762064 [Suillus tomentosus]|nr:hypothetical protein C8R48DRAFT_762064 [Suillus tomentosus]
MISFLLRVLSHNHQIWNQSRNRSLTSHDLNRYSASTSVNRRQGGTDERLAKSLTFWERQGYTGRCKKKSGLRIVNAHAELSTHTWDGIEEWVGEDGTLGLKDPKIVESDVQVQISLLRKLKFLCLEQNAKDKYVKTIVSDDAPLVTPALNEELRVRNEEKKAALREHKAKLAERRDDLRALSGFVEEDYKKAQALTLQASTLSQKIPDAPNQQLDGQVEEMQALDAELADAHEKIATLRSVRAEVEKAAEISADERVEDGRVTELYDWFSTTTLTYHALVSLLSAHSESNNELRLTYRVHEREVCITLLFIPNTRRLAEARAEGVEEHVIGDVVDAHVMETMYLGFYGL